MDDDVVAGDPVDGGGDAVLVAGLERVDDAEDLGGVAAGGGRVREDGADLLGGVDDEDGADGEGDALGVDVCGVLVVEPMGLVVRYCSDLGLYGMGGGCCLCCCWRALHVVEVRNLPLLVRNNGELDAPARNLVNVLDPPVVAIDRVGRKPNHLDAPLGELGLQLGKGAELGGAHGGVVLRVREEDDPLVADELVEVDGAGRGVGLEVGGLGAEAEARRC